LLISHATLSLIRLNGCTVQTKSLITDDPTLARSGNMQARLWEIDSARGVAIIMMTIFHLMWDLWFFRILPDVVLYAGFWKYFQRTTAILFLLMVGVSLTISYRRAKRRAGQDARLWPKFFWRGLRIFGWGLVITLVVWAAGVGYVHFGILHLIGLSIILAYPLLPYRWVNLASWAALFLIGGWLQNVRVAFPWLVWLGLQPPNYAPNDYFPLVPWFGVVILGVVLGNSLYHEDRRRFPLPDWSGAPLIRLLQFLGRHSLTIYLIHQPLLLAILYALGLVRF
jgi:uncharacterized membrane protein